MLLRNLFVIIILLASSAAAEPRRIVSTTPSITEILFALGLGGRVVGVTNYCHYPPETAKIPKIGSYMQPNMEAILAARPDLVIVQRNPVGLTLRMRKLGLPVLEIDSEKAAGLGKAIGDIARATGAEDRGRQLAQSIEREMDAIRKKVAGKPKPKVLFVIARSPGSMDGLMAAGEGSYLNELLVTAGGVNLFADSSNEYPKVNFEQILARQPDVIIDMGDMADTASVTERQRRAVLDLWARYPSIPAVRDHRVFAVAEDVFVVPGPRVAEAASRFGRMLHPELAW